MSKGYVYVLSNPSMPGVLKIGKTTRDVNARANELYQTGVPTPFKVEHHVYAPDCDHLEAAVHHHLAKDRPDPAREFFSTPLEAAIELIEDQLREQVEEWLELFLPHHLPVHCSEYIDPPSLLFLSKVMGVPFEDLVDYLDWVTPEDLQPAIERKKREEQPFMKQPQVAVVQ